MSASLFWTTIVFCLAFCFGGWPSLMGALAGAGGAILGGLLVYVVVRIAYVWQLR